MEKESKTTALNVELVGIKNLKLTHSWRIEFDVFEIDNDKVKDLMDMLNRPISMGLVEINE
ncbi:MAG TPA: hypothetical protein DEG69_05405 [Flavobacteriaceae bacterium]|nr:hypothetical protein [Flavobacteriaceae bacterium]